MFGGLAFMVRGHMCCGLVKDKLMVRVDPNTYDQLLDLPGVQPMDFTGKPMRGFLYVTGVGISTAKALRTWVSRALDFAESRPPKTSRSVRARSTSQPDRSMQPTSRARLKDNPKHRSRAVRGGTPARYKALCRGDSGGR